jgi:SAM-dependent methyltransferase
VSRTADITALNRAAWNASARHHASGHVWDETCTTLRRGESLLDAILTEALISAGIKGARLVQVGCNNGREALSAMTLGASDAWGIDQSEAFLAQAASLTALSPHTATFLRADIYDLPPEVPRDFDIALITIGVLNWMPDLPGFFAAVAGLLRAGGQLLIYETHPILEMFEPRAEYPHALVHSYFRTAPHVETQSITYDGTVAGGAPEAHWFPHTLSVIIQSAIDAGLILNRFAEYPHSIREVDYDIYQNRAAQVPMSFMLCATRAQAAARSSAG